MAEKISFDLHQQFVGKQMTILTEKTDDAHPGMISGHTENFLLVWVPQENLKSNELVTVDFSNWN